MLSLRSLVSLLPHRSTIPAKMRGVDLCQTRRSLEPSAARLPFDPLVGSQELLATKWIRRRPSFSLSVSSWASGRIPRCARLSLHAVVLFPDRASECFINNPHGDLSSNFRLFPEAQIIERIEIPPTELVLFCISFVSVRSRCRFSLHWKS
jgi:hypothetical protein